MFARRFFRDQRARVRRRHPRSHRRTLIDRILGLRDLANETSVGLALDVNTKSAPGSACVLVVHRSS
jgi:hypothetical protein